jgi:Uri superfamily endonuclease
MKFSVEYAKKCYIGSTIRRLHERIQAHLRNTNSSVYRHSLTFTNVNLLLTANRWKIRLLSQDCDSINAMNFSFKFT